MNNCLVTKLKGIVDNDNLPIMGVIELDVNYTREDSRYAGFGLNSGQSVEIIGDGYFMNTSHDVIGKTYTFSGSGILLLSYGTYKLRIYNKYDILYFGSSQTPNNVSCNLDLSIKLDINDIFESTKIEEIYFGNFFPIRSTCNIAKLIYETNVTSINTNSSNLYYSGNLDKNITKLMYLNLSGGVRFNITGDINVFVGGLMDGAYLRETEMTGEFSTLFDTWATNSNMIGKSLHIYTNAFTTLNGVQTTNGQNIYVKINNGSWELLN